MENNKKLLKVGIALICIAFLVNVIIYKCLEVKGPLFLKHYYESEFYDGMVFDISYICNRIDDYRVKFINFGENAEENVFVEVVDNNTRTIGNYKLNQMIVVLREINLGENSGLKDTLTLDKAEVRLNNGEILNVDFGKIILKPYTEKTDAISMHMASSSNDNTSRCEYKVNETVKIEVIESEINDSDILDMTFNGEDIRNIAYPIVVEKGEIVEFASKPKVSRNDVRRYNYYDVNKSMRFIDANGQEQNQGVYNLRYTPYFDYWDILRIIKSNE